METVPTPESATPEAAAARWLVRLGGADLAPEERCAFRAWLEADPAHATAFAAAERLWADLRGPAAELGADGWHRDRPRRRIALPMLALAMAALVLAWNWTGADLVAQPGFPETMILADGSRLTLEAGSQADLAIGPLGRRLELRRGRLFVEVTPDPLRPFVVAAAGTETEVRGTAFGVALAGEGVEVAVEHGRVRVRDQAGDVVDLVGGEGIAGTRDGLGAPGPAALDTALAWRQGVLAFDAASLAEVAEAVSRVGGLRVLVPQSGTRALRLSGVFRADDPEATLAAIEAGLGLTVLRVPGVGSLVLR